MAKPENERERIARIIDPRLADQGWVENYAELTSFDGGETTHEYVHRIALAKADEVLAIIAQRESGGAESPVFDMSGWKSFLAAPAEAQARVEALARQWEEECERTPYEPGNECTGLRRGLTKCASELRALLSGSTPKPAGVEG